ncbi:DUF805 domain-containing protein [Staphylococcus delphini]|uniref:DUF805 domain-containing protein n=1 Tax=Staphylococcus delphini TaxID=53344 RepID=A0AAX0QTR6_9STAP|nr:DUF805 domain-containing protein [Staphylococcus delphini]PCF50288.1 DUF805 domain-containing protein [Staphylococcus delphini]PNZ94320.1 DUF805 domain-containing protein [Staphylococcus delphini]RIZ55557.1 DUF805 domain-containing protein [Staphylococcus delphini]
MNLETPKVGFVEAFKLYWTNYVNFKGRSRRSEYWWVMLWHLIIMIPALFLGVVLMFIPILGWIVAVILFIAIGLYSLATIIPNLALTVRRFHDVGFSMLIPILSFILGIIYNIASAFTQKETLFEDEATSTNVSVVNEFAFLPSWVAFTLMAISIILSLVTLIVCLLDSKEQDNQYGPSPKYGRQYVGGDRNHAGMAYQHDYRNDTMTQQDGLRDIEETEKKDDPYRY